jgi:hypothetical protein
MTLRGIFFLFFSAIVLPACATELRGENPRAEIVPDLNAFLLQYEGDTLCETTVPLSETVRTKNGDELIRRDFCYPTYPAKLQRHGYEARCDVKLRIGTNGNSIVDRSDCNVFGGSPDQPDWDAFAKAVLEEMTRRATERHTFDIPADWELANEALFVQPYMFILN